MAQYTCTLNWKGSGPVEPVYSPTQGQGGIFSVGDEITFFSPDTSTVIDFVKGSPFEPDAQPIPYPIAHDATVPKTIVRSCFACSASAPGATAGTNSFPTQGMPGNNITHECRVILNAGAIQFIYPVGKKLLFEGDILRFVNETGLAVTINFDLRSPFDLAAVNTSFPIGAGQSVDKRVQHTCFKFTCAVKNSKPEGAGLCVPTSD